MKRTLTILAAIAGVATIAAVVIGIRSTPARPSKPLPSGILNVTASFYPLAEFSRQVGGNHVTVTTITPAGAEPHDYEPTPRQIADTYSSDLLIFNGGGVDTWAERLAPSLATRGVATLRMDQLMGALLPPGDPEEQASFDPHFWLDPVLAERQVEAVRDEFTVLDPANADDYRANAAAYIAKLATLDASFKAGLASCTLHTVVTSHAAFAYLGRRYDFTQLPISGLSPDEEPSAGKLADIANEAKAQRIKFIFFETLVNPQLADTIAREIGAQTLVFNPLEGLTDQEIADGDTYLTVMEQNLTNLRIALQCQ